MTERRAREAMRSEPVPDHEGAEERAWRVVSAAFYRRRHRAARPWRRPAVVLASIAAAIVVALTPPGEALGDWIADTLRPARAPSKPVLTSLPSDGRLLVRSEQGPWVVQPNGSKRRLGGYDEAGWSPGGLFVVATRGRQLVALEPDGDVRWTLARPERVKAPTWSPDGFRIAYLSGDDLRVVAGDGTGDAPVGADPAVVIPAWRPDDRHVLVWATAAGRVRALQTDTGETLWTTDVGEPPRSLHWTPDGSRVVAVFDRRVEILTEAGRRVRTIAVPTGARADAASVHPSEPTLALSRFRPASGRSDAVALDLETGRERRLFAGQGRFSDLAWSPDGEWLLLAWRDADQWLFLRSDEVRRIEAVANVSRQFDPGGTGPAAFPGLGGWCCPLAGSP